MALVDQTSGLHIPGKLVPPNNWHITLKFLGEADRVSYERVLAGLGLVEKLAPFPIRLAGFGAFPKPQKATVVWAGVSDGFEDLSFLNEVTEEAAQSAGFESEERPYRPHLTLSRIRPPVDVRRLVDEPLDLRWKNTEVVVYRSHLGRDGAARYEPLEIFTLFG
jgi:2'-5' RNA ligase